MGNLALRISSSPPWSVNIPELHISEMIQDSLRVWGSVTVDLTALYNLEVWIFFSHNRNHSVSGVHYGLVHILRSWSSFHHEGFPFRKILILCRLLWFPVVTAFKLNASCFYVVCICVFTRTSQRFLPSPRNVTFTLRRSDLASYADTKTEHAGNACAFVSLLHMQAVSQSSAARCLQKQVAFP